jgi:hypothetical protein
MPLSVVGPVRLASLAWVPALAPSGLPALRVVLDDGAVWSLPCSLVRAPLVGRLFDSLAAAGAAGDPVYLVGGGSPGVFSDVAVGPPSVGVSAPDFVVTSGRPCL